MGIVVNITQGIVSSAIVGIVLMGIYMLSSRSRARAQSPGAGEIRLNPKVMGGLAVLAFGFAAVALYAARVHDAGFGALVMCSVFALTGYYAAALMHPDYAVRWDRETVSGPTSYGVWPLGPRRATIRYDDIELAGTDWADSWYVEDARGNRIRWNYYYNGFGHLMTAVEHACPHLFATGED